MNGSRHEISLAAGVLPEFRADIVADAAGAAGYRLAGFTVDPASWSQAMMRRVRQRVQSWDLGVLDVEVAWIPAGGRLDGGHRLIVDVGAELGARNLLVVSSEPDRDRTAAALRQLCEWAPPGMRVALEFLMITAVRDLETALAIVQACDHPAAALLIDSVHLQRAGNTPADLAGLNPELFPYAQLCDGNLACADEHEAYLEDALDLRSAPGEGELPLHALLDQLREDCPLSLEVRSKRYRDAFPDPTARAAAIRAQTLAFLAER